MRGVRKAHSVKQRSLPLFGGQKGTVDTQWTYNSDPTKAKSVYRYMLEERIGFKQMLQLFWERKLRQSLVI
jgi:hypothetical protein